MVATGNYARRRVRHADSFGWRLWNMIPRPSAGRFANAAAMVPAVASGPTFRDSANTVVSGTTVTLPTRTSGDALIAVFVFTGAAGFVDGANTGWTRSLGAFSAGAGSTDVAVYTRISNGTDNTPIDGLGMSTGKACTVVSVSNVATGYDTNNPGSGATGSIVCPTVTPGGSPSLLLSIYVRALSTGTITPPGGQTALPSVSDGVGSTLDVAYESLATNAATGTRTATQSTSLGWAGVNLTVK